MNGHFPPARKEGAKRKESLEVSQVRHLVRRCYGYDTFMVQIALLDEVMSSTAAAVYGFPTISDHHHISANQPANSRLRLRVKSGRYETLSPAVKNALDRGLR